MAITWAQYYYDFSIDTIDKATYNVIKIKEKILELNKKLETEKEVGKIAQTKELIDRLEMSKECIIYYYGLEINL
jgi:hypothetical protein